MNAHPFPHKSPWKFIWIVYLLSLPFYFLGTLIDRFFPKGVPINLPFSAVMFVCPMAVALFLTYREDGSRAAGQLLKRVFDYRRIPGKLWYLPAFLLWPAFMLLEYAVLKLGGGPLPGLHNPGWMALISFALFFVGAIGEELGWLGYALEPLQTKWGALGAALILGSARAIWHIVPFIQTHNPPAWILWQCLFTVTGQVLVVWLYNTTGKSIFAAVIFHAAYNVASVVLPNSGFIYDPFLSFIITSVAAAVVIYLWGPQTLARFRFPPVIRTNQPGAVDRTQP